MRGWYWWVRRRRRRDLHWVRVAAEGVIAIGLLASGAAIARVAGAPLPFARSWLASPAAASPTPSPPTVRVDVITAAGGRAILVTTGGQAALIDGGAGPTGEAVVARLKQLGIGSLVAAFMTRGGTSAASGLIAVMDAVPVQRLYDLVPGNDCPAHQGVLADARAHDIPVRTAQRGRSLVLGPAKVQVLWPPAQLGGSQEQLANDPGLVGLLDGRVQMLFADGLTSAELPSIERLGRDLRAQVLELPDGGSAGNLPRDFLSAVSPRVALLEPTTAGPAPAVLADLAAAHVLGVEVGRTSDLYLQTDGAGLTLAMAAGEAGVAPPPADVPPPVSGACA